jgi:hypothetical protein
MVNQDGWELYDLTQPTTSHPEEDAQRRELARQDAARRARLPEWEAVLPAAEAAVREKWAAIGAVKARLADAQAAYNRRYKQVTGGQGLRDPVYGLPIVPQDDERCQPELGRRQLVEQELAIAKTEHGQAVAQCQALIEEIALIKGTVPARA